jgi:hypothetical protein
LTLMLAGYALLEVVEGVGLTTRNSFGLTVKSTGTSVSAAGRTVV